MVNFEKSLRQARRYGWEAAYLDYNKLKRILSQLRHSQVHQFSYGEAENGRTDTGIALPLADDVHDESHRIKEIFFQELGEEIEKISLFTLKTQGALSEAIGHLRFRNDDTISVNTLFPDKESISRQHYPGMKKLVEDDDLEMYLMLGVELLFLIQFVGVNTLAVRKALKKYNKTIRQLNKPEYTYILSGNGDSHLQLFTNSQSLSAIHSSLQAAMVDFFLEDEVISTDPERQLTFFRFQSIIHASYVLQRNSEVVNQPFKDFLSRKAMINVGSSLGGLEGSEINAMNVVISFRPITMLTSDFDRLNSFWSRWSPKYDHWKTTQTIQKGSKLQLQEITQYAMDILAFEELDRPTLNRSISFIEDTKSRDFEFEEKVWGGVDMPSMILNLASILLYTINYYIIAPTANRYAVALGENGAYGATLIGASSFSAIIAALMYSFWYINRSFKSALIFSTICPLFGNLIYSLAISYDSMTLALGGRFLCGFGSAEVINRQIISTCVSFEQITRASAFFVAGGAMGMSIGPLIAAILDDTTGRDFFVDLQLPFNPAGGIIFNSVTSPGFFMAILWLIELLCLIFFFNEPDRINAKVDEDNQGTSVTETTPLIKTHYGSMENERISSESSSSSNSDCDSDKGSSNLDSGNCLEGLGGSIMSVSSLLLMNQGLPVTLLLFCYIELADEVLISSCSMVVRRYFGWHASAAGYLVASLGALVLPANFVVEIFSRRVSERFIMKVAICFIIVCCLGIFNYQGLYYDLIGISTYGQFDPINVRLKKLRLSGESVGHLFTDAKEFPYDWDYGIAVYVTFLSLIFAGTIVLEGVTTSIMAQVTPSQLNTSFLNCGLLATLIGTLGRVLSDSMITMAALLDIHVFIDFVNATFMPLLLLAIGGLFLVDKFYDKLV
eukprot:CAMPEP_0172389406 /NCGR_PEP_ID=MMETSP1061-20121228/6302_1 /TAXON_ID=37318 /ORGANISM="Pseudo-nitzschia pungens, Strain cf. pungens" /LENGTH=899 /DNA_ID=CAMNT_0013119549 /DNA_START=199 /DNA_END=2898 /DNA_ORIENTATION=-